MKSKNLRVLVTGGAGFIGSALIRRILGSTEYTVLNIDKLTYASNVMSLAGANASPKYSFKQVDICDYVEVKKVVFEFKPNIIFHLAAESHVDRSIRDAHAFLQTNVVGTYVLLEVARKYYQSVRSNGGESFRFHHISTDEVYGDLVHPDDWTGKSVDLPRFSELTAYNPSSPYSASKASSDHLVKAWGRTHGLPFVITNCSNNYGPYHHPEKLIPSIILKAIHGERLPIYGNGRQIRDWLYVDDHADALLLVARFGKNGEQYNIGGNNELMNKDVVVEICDLLEERVLVKPGEVDNFRDLISYVGDRAGHDKRYAVDTRKIYLELGWVPKQNFRSGLQKTVDWFLSNEDWWREVYAREYKNYN